jgi:hypothetical protein
MCFEFQIPAEKGTKSGNIVQYALFQILWSILYYATVTLQIGAKPAFHMQGS